MKLLASGVLVIATVSAAFNANAQGMEGPGGRGHGMMMFGGSPEHVGRGIDHMLDGLGATDAQRSQIKQIAMSAAADLKAQREAGRALHEKGMQIFAAPTVDAAAAEAVRQQMLAQHDQASKRMLQAMLDVSKVLTPEQRAKMAARMKERRATMHDRMQRDHAPSAPK
ncbi:MAG: Spy/CpxP family protein refolding chaperone [Burkholderiales bacterium]